MKTFLRKTGLFLIILSGLFFICFAALSYVNFRSFNNFRINPGINTIFIGDSHIQLGIDEKLIPNSINLSQLSEPYKFTFLKLQVILKNNIAIKRLYLGFSYNNLSSGYDEAIDGKLSKDVSAMYFFIFPSEEKFEYLNVCRGNLLEYFKIIMINGLKNMIVKNHRQTFLGHYENDFYKTGAKISSIDKRIKFQYYKDSSVLGFSEKNIYYLDKIIQLCKAYKIELVLLNMPLHPYYKSKVPSKFIEKYNTFLSERNLKPLDLSALKLDDSCYVSDGDHLSAKGASLLAVQLKQ